MAERDGFNAHQSAWQPGTEAVCVRVCMYMCVGACHPCVHESMVCETLSSAVRSSRPRRESSKQGDSVARRASSSAGRAAY